MALFNTKKKEDFVPAPAVQEPVVSVEPEEPVQAAPVQSADTLIGEGVIFDGDFVTSESIEINGTLTGNIVSSSKVTISETGKYSGDTKSCETYISGNAQGTLTCSGITKINSTGEFKGTLQTAELATDAGSKFEGNLNLVGKSAPAPVKEAAPEIKAEEGDHAVTEEEIFGDFK